ncbi:hypothetical protein [Chryseobacterium binzhouense]|uniref:hypothetical protein n=1 Tax=Chryseobacterium binzhouense TaxID=2593646 RepID=UPI00117D273B|nr:hypothetical protein [Chryseobacterium binzhouense]
MQKNIFYIVCIFLISCNSNKKILESNFYEENKNINLYCFVGERVSVEYFDPNVNYKKKVKDPTSGDSIIVTEYYMDEAFLCKYIVRQNVFNKIDHDTIHFEAYDHYGTPEFKNYKYALLYLSKNDKGEFIHMKYQFDAIKNTKKASKEEMEKVLKDYF